MRKHEDDKIKFCWDCCTRSGGVGFGIFLLLLGGFFLAQDLGWIASDVSFWPVILIGFGLYFVLKRILK